MSEQTVVKMNKKRQAIWDKSGGLCWYCGCELSERGWHADHLEPLGRQPNSVTVAVALDEDGWSRTIRTEHKRPPSHPERNHIDNLVPACQSCNTIKGMSSVEGFRKIIGQFMGSLNRYVNQYKIAKRYGLITETQQPVIFWFERRTNHE